MIDFNDADYFPITNSLAPYLEQSFLDKILTISHVKIPSIDLTPILFINTYYTSYSQSVDFIYQDVAGILNHGDILDELVAASPIFSYNNGYGKYIVFCWLQLPDTKAQELIDLAGNFYKELEIANFNHIKDIPNPKTTSQNTSEIKELIPNTTNRVCHNCYNETIALFHLDRFCPNCKI